MTSTVLDMTTDMNTDMPLTDSLTQPLTLASLASKGLMSVRPSMEASTTYLRQRLARACPEA